MIVSYIQVTGCAGFVRTGCLAGFGCVKASWTSTLERGSDVHLKLVQHLLGHASITMTLDRYSYWIPSMGRHAAEGMDGALEQ
jgi:integrase